LKGLHEITKKNGALLIVDEVITGFRLQNGSVQELLGVEADLTTLEKSSVAGSRGSLWRARRVDE